ncbi:hypothetical protein [Filimonas effusa]
MWVNHKLCWHLIIALSSHFNYDTKLFG